MIAVIILLIVIAAFLFLLSTNEDNILPSMLLVSICVAIGIASTLCISSDKSGAIKLYRGDYKIEILETYSDSVLVKTDTVVIDLRK